MSGFRLVIGGHTIDGGRSAIDQELRREDRVTAIVAATNVATLGAIKAIQSQQLAMPRDISLIGFDDFVACKGEVGAKEAGKMRLEGKDYVVRDGDVMHFRFNV